MKAVLVLDKMPEGCWECPCATVVDGKYYLCEVTFGREFDGAKIIDSCPLHPLSERKKEMDYLAAGYNKCLDDILEGE